MFASVVFDLVFQYFAKRSSGNNVPEMIVILCRVGRETLTQSTD